MTPNHLPKPIRKHPQRSVKTASIIPSVSGDPLAQFTETVQVPCEECDGVGLDRGAVELHAWDAPPCPACKGSKTMLVERNYLSEAFRIVNDEGCPVHLERKHLLAITRFARQSVSATMMADGLMRLFSSEVA